jgi:galactose oxidase
VLVRMSSVTHTINTDQHFLELAFAGSNSGYSVTAPANTGVVPGRYMLFALNSQGVPSLSTIVRVGP